MSIMNDIKDHPGTIPFFGYPAGIEIDMNKEAWTNVDFTKDMVLKFTFPMGVDNIDEVAEKARKYFDGEILDTEPRMIIIKADLKMVGYTLIFSLRDQYHNI